MVVETGATHLCGIKCLNLRRSNLQTAASEQIMKLNKLNINIDIDIDIALT